MRVCLVVREFPKVSETFVASHFLGLAERGWDVHVACVRCEPAQVAAFERLRETDAWRGRVHKSWPQRPRWLAAALAIPSVARCVAANPRGTARYLVRGWRRFGLGVLRRLYVDAPVVCARPDLVHFEFGAIAKDRTHVGDLLGVKTVVSFRGYDLTVSGLDDADWYGQVWRDVDAIHLLGEELWSRARRRGCPPEAPHVFIPPAVDTQYFDGVRDSHVDIAGAPERPLRILSVGRLDWRKGYEYAVGTIRDLVDRGVACEYRIVGDGDSLEAVAFARHQLGLGDVVTLVGAADRDEVRRHLCWADVVLHSAVSEGFCNSVIEAQAMRVPVVASDAGGLPENVVDGLTGFVVARRTTEPAAAALETLARCPDVRERFGDAGRARAVERFDVRGQIAAFEALYRSTLDGASPGARAPVRAHGVAPLHQTD